MLGLGLGNEIETQNNDNNDGVFDFPAENGRDSGGLRVVGFGSDSDSSSEEEGEFGSGRNGDDERVVGFDDFDVRLCWDSLCLEDHRSLNEWEEVEERVNEIEVEDQSVASGFDEEDEEEEPGEEALRYLEWEILLAVNNLERNSNSVLLEHGDDENVANVADSYLEFQEGYISAADYDVLFGQFLENESVSKGSPPAAKGFVESLPLVELTEEELRGKDVACAICKDEIVLEEKVRRLPCSHCYHGDCILPWLSIRNTCPVCRFELPTDDPDYEQSKTTYRAARDLLQLATQMQF